MAHVDAHGIGLALLHGFREFAGQWQQSFGVGLAHQKNPGALHHDDGTGVVEGNGPLLTQRLRYQR